MRTLPSFRITTFAWIVTIGLLITVASTTTVFLISVRNAEHMEETWTRFESVEGRKALLLSQMRGLLGYDGVIHHFKNLVLRKERRRIIVIHDKFLEFSIALTAFQALGLDEHEKNALSALHDVMARYKKLVSIVETMADAGMPPREIDRAARVDDTSAIQALEVLDRRLTALHKANSQNIVTSVQNTTLFAKRSGVLLVAILLAISALTIWFTHWRLIRPLRSLVNAFENVDPREPIAMRLSTEGKRSNDELSVLVRSGNRFIDTVQGYCEALRVQKMKTAKVKTALAKEKELNDLQRQFVSMISHEFRTPLAIIDGAAQRIIRRGGQLTPDDIKKRTGKIRNAVKRMIMLIDSTLSAARLQAGTIAMSPQTIDLAAAIAVVCKRQQGISRKRKISVDVVGIIAPVFADPAMLDQVFTNLMSNADKYSPDDSPIEVKGWMEGGQVVVSVRDYGLGIPESDLPMLFQQFFRARNSAGIAGTGIGLHLVKQLMEMHGGSIEIESVEGEGSTFTVRLPIKPANGLIARDPAGSPSLATA